MQETFSEKFSSHAIDYLVDIKKRYEKAFETSLDEKVFRIEEECYKYITKSFSDYWIYKINLAEEIRKNYFKTWEIAFRHKYMQDKKLATYSKNEQKILKQIYDEQLCAYYSLKIFADCRFTRENILNLSQPDCFAFSLSRSAYPTNRYLHIIIDDLICYLGTQNQNNNDVMLSINYALLEKARLTHTEIIVAKKLFTRKPLKKIAEELCVGENTIKTHRHTFIVS